MPSFSVASPQDTLVTSDDSRAYRLLGGSSSECSLDGSSILVDADEPASEVEYPRSQQADRIAGSVAAIAALQPARDGPVRQSLLVDPFLYVEALLWRDHLFAPPDRNHQTLATLMGLDGVR